MSDENNDKKPRDPAREKPGDMARKRFVRQRTTDDEQNRKPTEPEDDGSV